jgi:hypothetical protein
MLFSTCYYELITNLMKQGAPLYQLLAKRGVNEPSWAVAATLGFCLACSAGGDGGEAAGAAGAQALPEPVPPRHSEQPALPTSVPARPLFDEEDTKPALPERCDKVDFLYIVDNSASMADKQQNLARSFEGFTRIVQETLGTSDHQIMVVDTDDMNIGDELVLAETGAEPDGCTGMLGAGLVMGELGMRCGIRGNQRFLKDNQPNLAEAFSCLAQVGTLGDVDERPMDALLAATGAVENDLGDCNQGFLRDDAVLVVTLITDEEDDKSMGEPVGWKRSLLKAKNGNEDGLVMLGLISDTQVPGGLPGGPCDELSGARSPRLMSFVESFRLSAMGSVCAEDYSEFFAEAVAYIDTACDEFKPF